MGKFLACFVFLFDVIGTPDYVLNTPLFQHTTINRGTPGSADEKPFHIIAMGAGQDRQYSKEVFLNSQAVSGPLLSDLDITPGGMLQFVLDSPEEQQGDHAKVFAPEDLVDAAVAVAPAVPAAPSEDVAAELERQQLEIAQLRQQLHDYGQPARPHAHSHEDLTHHIALEPVVQHHVSDTGLLLSGGSGAEAEAAGCGHSSTMYTGLVVLCVNLIIVCWMLALQVQKYRNDNNVVDGGTGERPVVCLLAYLHCCTSVSATCT